MDDLNQGGGLSGLNMARMLPLIFILMVLTGNGVIGIQMILPAYQEHQVLLTDVERLRMSVAAANQDTTEADIMLLERQIEGAQTTLTSLAPLFINHTEAGTILDRLYGYAAESTVDITALQVYTPDVIPDGEAIVLHSLRLQVMGEAYNLFAFITRIRELSLPGITVSNLTLNAGPDHHILIFELLIYTTELAPEGAFADLPPLQLPEPVLLAEPTEGTPSDAVAGAGIPEVDLETGEAKEPVNAVCNDAPVPRFAPGDAAVVDFNAGGALRILSRLEGGGVYTLTQAYDNDVLIIEDGPVCGTWQGASIWYWQVSFEGVVGWAAEATATDRWLCPMHDPECS